MMFTPSAWSNEVTETKLDTRQQVFNHYMARYILGLPIPEWMESE